MARTTPTDRDYERLARFRYSLRRFLRFSEDAARGVGVSPAQYQLMLFVKSFRTKPPTVSDLAERMQVSHHSAVELIGRSLNAGLLRRLRDTKDARRVRIRLTSKGARVLAVLVSKHYARLADLRRSVPAPFVFRVEDR